jgi:hypothetical protein
MLRLIKAELLRGSRHEADVDLTLASRRAFLATALSPLALSLDMDEAGGM